MTASGILAGIARHGRSRGPIELLDAVSVTTEGGVQGDFRGAIRPGGKGRRQISLITAEGWAAAMGDLRLSADEMLPWHARRVNLLSQGIVFPQFTGYVIAIGRTVRFQVTKECDPCGRMEELLPGLKGAMLPDWRGGLLGKVLTGGDIALGDEIRIER
jgi:MOSC domain-containing protein YiiM